MNSNQLLSGKVLRSNILIVLTTYALPFLIAFLTLPIFIKNLGLEIYGIFTLIMAVIGYSNILDLGVSRALVQIISGKIAEKKNNEIEEYLKAGIIFLLIIGIFFGMLFYFIANNFVHEIFELNKAFKKELSDSYLWISLSIPFVLVSNGFRASLESIQKFKEISKIKIPISILLIVIPVIISAEYDNLSYLIFSVLVIRIVEFFSFYIKTRSDYRLFTRKFNIKRLKEIFKLSSWMTVSNLIGPIINNIDRFFVGIFLSVKDVSYYTPSADLVIRGGILANSILNVMFPAFSYVHLLDNVKLKKLFDKTIKTILYIHLPIVFFIILFSDKILLYWLGDDFSEQGSLLLKFLAYGFFLNSVAKVEFGYLQSIGKPKLTAMINLIELPIFVYLIYVFIDDYGINGVAFIWSLRMVIDLVLMSYFCLKLNFHLREIIYQLLKQLVIFTIIIFVVEIYLTIVLKILVLVLVIIWSVNRLLKLIFNKNMVNLIF